MGVSNCSPSLVTLDKTRFPGTTRAATVSGRDSTSERKVNSGQGRYSDGAAGAVRMRASARGFSTTTVSVRVRDAGDEADARWLPTSGAPTTAIGVVTRLRGANGADGMIERCRGWRARTNERLGRWCECKRNTIAIARAVIAKSRPQNKDGGRRKNYGFDLLNAGRAGGSLRASRRLQARLIQGSSCRKIGTSFARTAVP